MLEHYIPPHHCTDTQNNHQNSFGVLDLYLPQVKQRNIVFFKKKVPSFPTTPFFQNIRNILCNFWWTTEQRQKGLNSQDPFHFGEQKCKKILELFVTNKQTGK